RLILTIKPYGNVDPRLLEYLRDELDEIGQVSLSAAATVPGTFTSRKREGQVQYLASEFEKALAREPGDRVLAVTDVDLYDGGLNLVLGHATIRDRFAVISIARFGKDGREKLMERSAKTASHELGQPFGLCRDDANADCARPSAG